MHILTVFLHSQEHELGERFIWQIKAQEDDTVLRHGSAESPIDAVLDAVTIAELEGYTN